MWVDARKNLISLEKKFDKTASLLSLHYARSWGVFIFDYTTETSLPDAYQLVKMTQT